MDTKLKSDIAENAVLTELLRRGFNVLKPVGDRLPYDLGLDLNGRLIRIQVKSAWKRKSVYIVDNRRTKTNRRHMIRSPYCSVDFDIAVLFIDDLNACYVMPVKDFCAYGSEITLSGGNSLRKSRSDRFLSRWDLINS